MDIKNDKIFYFNEYYILIMLDLIIIIYIDKKIFKNVLNNINILFI